ncbi:protein kinase domain-containing protein [Kitasatospora sp. LaBMicrA B282]|uniref:protein kinase domain-containing protein n=1 Tax=Kitasatospora sp. LaBMicrA B282 TaxID=3420949 RepID=UPI003D109485
MAEVLAAQDIRLGRTVAVKLLRPELAQDDVARRRFTREAHSVASLNHHSIVAVYDIGEEHVGGESTPYIVMELVEGRTVRELLVGEEEPPPVDQALIIIAGVLEALDYSHRHGIVHRDIKPANVSITTTGAVKVMDFGIARALAGEATTMTQTGMVMGTPQYLSPEQALGKPVDHRSDLYAAGCMLYELLALRPPFTGDTPLSVVYQHVQDAPMPPAQANSRVPWQLDELVLRSLAKNPDERFQSADEFRAHVQHALREMHAGNYPVDPHGGPGRDTPSHGVDATQVLGLGGVPPMERTTVLPYGSGAAAGPQGGRPAYGGAAGGYPGGAGGGYAGGGHGGGADGYDDGYQEEPRRGGGRKALAWAAGVLLVVAAGIGVAVAANSGGTGGTGGGGNVVPPQPSTVSTAPDSPSDQPSSLSPTPSTASPTPSRSRQSYTPPTDGGQTQPSYRPTHSASPSTSASSSASASASGSASATPSGGSSATPTGGSSQSAQPTGGGTGGGGTTGGGSTPSTHASNPIGGNPIGGTG